MTTPPFLQKETLDLVFEQTNSMLNIINEQVLVIKPKSSWRVPDSPRPDCPVEA